MFDPDHVDVELPELASLGLDPLADGVDAGRRCRPLLAGRRTRLKPLLLDQHVIAGIGNIYADEILHAARLHPERQRRLAAAGRGRAGCTTRCTTSWPPPSAPAARRCGDAQYVDLMGGGGSYQDDHRVYGRAGERCTTCGRGIIRRTVSAGRSTHFCPVSASVGGPPTEPRSSR